MEILISIIIGILFTVGTYMLLMRSLLRVVVGTMLLSHGAHLLLLTMAGLQRGGPPLLGFESEAYTDPLPQAMVLTAIVISFGLTSFMFVLAYRTYKVHKTDDLNELRGSKDE